MVSPLAPVKQPADSFLARLLLLGFVTSLLLCALASPAQAQPQVPTLTVTTPESPNLSTTPRILGHAGGVGTSVVARSFLPPRSFAVDPASTITIHTDPGCSGPVAATGSLSTLEGAGIQVTVGLGSTTEFYATLTDPSEPGVPSPCSSPGLVYKQVSAAPQEPLLTSVDPASPADDNTPRLVGSAEAGATVSIYTDPACLVGPLAAGTATTFASKGIEVVVPDNSTTTFYARAAWAGLFSPCSSSSVTYQEISAEEPVPPGGPGGSGGQPGGQSPATVPAVAPGQSASPGRPAPPRLHTDPGGRANDSTPLVVGSAVGAARVDVYGSADCSGARVASGSRAEFAAGIPVRVAPNTTVSFSAVAIDGDGERSRCSPEPAVYTEDSAPPVTRITFGPGTKTHKRIQVFRFSDITGDPPGTAFACKLDRRPWRACQSPWRLSRVGPKFHTVRVHAVDAAGNQELGAAKRRFKVVAR